ncbi:hypothetical protein RHMOL_Rhmol08G0198000 [Rhododendron molle]|uniref:Uncharacterized protein n=1 Tax=Rhododendron molle TaxID=49168 RepID=A0ACC0MRP3_RHOML|nr:hypothetical protein RHMOL_Rhmol08G0198000 [Rhododendron molle]
MKDAKDLARVLCLLLIRTLFFPNTQARVSWAYLDFIEPLENSTLYNWSSFITEEVIHELNLRGSSKPTKVGGCVMGTHGEDVREKESKDKEEDAEGEKKEIENVDDEEEGGGFEIVQDEGGPEHIMVLDAEVEVRLLKHTRVY